MYELYAYATPNSLKPAILLEELEQPWQLRAVNVRQGEQKREDFLKMNPNGKVPVLRDSDKVLSESARKPTGLSVCWNVSLGKHPG